MASYTTAFSLSREVLNEIESRRGKLKSSHYVDTILREYFGLPEREKRGNQE